jgi:hypothetical protein
VFERERDCEPSPHDFVHVDHSSQSPTMQSFGQSCVLQALCDTELAQASPPKLGCVMARSRDIPPLPQEASQVFQAPHSEYTQSTGHACSLHTRTSWRYGH